jgi:hypothetical protein
MASWLVGLSMVVLVAHWLACFVFPLVRCLKWGVLTALLWGLGGLVFCPLVMVATQFKRLPSPAWWSWGVRLLLAVAIAWGLVTLGDSAWNESTPMVRLKGQFVSMLSPGRIIPAGRQLRCGDEVVDIESFGRAAFAVAGIIGAVAMFLYRSPVEKALVLVLASFVFSVVVDCVYLAQFCSAITASPPDEPFIEMLLGLRRVLNFWMPVILFFWLTVAWATWDARRAARPAVEETPADD